VDSVWEQKKLEARKMLENRETPTRQMRAALARFIFGKY
jgi:hypothetical protein